MTWLYHQSTGRLMRTGVPGVREPILIATGYSGHGDQKNDPAAEAITAEGPIPRGAWKIGAPYDSKSVGPFALRLEPVGHDAHGRSAFRIHGDSASQPGQASHGCIILPRGIREQIARSGDCSLQVVA